MATEGSPSLGYDQFRKRKELIEVPRAPFQFRVDELDGHVPNKLTRKHEGRVFTFHNVSTLATLSDDGGTISFDVTGVIATWVDAPIHER